MSLEKAKKRLDSILVSVGMAPSRAKAQALIMAGQVYVDGRKIDKASHLTEEGANIEIRKRGTEYVSRGGEKLSCALEKFNLDVSGFYCVDIGASTGGFTDCLLKNGAKKVYSIDVGHGQLDFSLRKDERVVAIEKTNIRNFDLGILEDDINLIVVDVSFIGLEKVFPKIQEIFKTRGAANASIITLIKPQFQVGRGQVGRGGVVRDEALRLKAITDVKKYASTYGWIFKDVIPSPIKGPKGNVEYLAYWQFMG